MGGQEKSASAIEQELGITAGLLSCRRCKQHRQIQTGNGCQGKGQADQCIQELERENVRLRQRREILKKLCLAMVMDLFLRTIGGWTMRLDLSQDLSSAFEYAYALRFN